MVKGVKKAGKILLWENKNKCRIVNIGELWDLFIPNPLEKYSIGIVR